MGSRDEILANFQVCTGIDDYGEAFVMLESCNWDLVEALNKAIPDQEPSHSSASFQAPPHNLLSNFTHTIDDTEVQVMGLRDMITRNSSRPQNIAVPILENIQDVIDIPSASGSSISEVIDINIKVVCEGASDESSFPLELPGSTTVGDLQSMLHQLVGILPCNQTLEGFLAPIYPELVITREILPRNLTLTLNANSILSTTLNNSNERLNGSSSEEYILTVKDLKNDKEYKLNYNGSKIIKEIYTDVFHLTNIAVRHQVWTGWPAAVTDYMTLAASGIPIEHMLTVGLVSWLNKDKPRKSSKNGVTKMEINMSEENSSADEFEDASSEIILPDDDFLVMSDFPSAQRCQALIPANINSEEDGCNKFIDEFTNRYGPSVPLFYRGSLSDALKNSVMLPARQRKLLAVYLHHDSSVLSNVFCSQTLCHVSLIEYLTSNFLIWGWDITHESNKTRLVDSVASTFGMVVSSTVKNFSLDKLPTLMVVNKSRGSIEVLSVLHGNLVLDEVMTGLLQCYEMFEDQRRFEVQEDVAREQRETVKAEQDAAYDASLEADRAKAEAKKIARMEERVERERQQSVKEKENEIQEAVKQSLLSELPDEPSADCGEPITVFRFRVPSKDIFIRAFTRRTPLRSVVNYLYIKGFPADKYKYLQSWPRRCITELDISKSIDTLKLPSQETITVEERVADDI